MPDDLRTLLDEFDRYASVPDQTGYVGSPFEARVKAALAAPVPVGETRMLSDADIDRAVTAATGLVGQLEHFNVPMGRDELRRFVSALPTGETRDGPPCKPCQGTGYVTYRPAERQSNEDTASRTCSSCLGTGTPRDERGSYGNSPRTFPREGEPRVRILVKAGALIAAEIDRLQRAASTTKGGGDV